MGNRQGEQVHQCVAGGADLHPQFQDAARLLPEVALLPHQRPSGIGGEVVGQFFDNKVGHVKLTFSVNRT